MAIAVEKEQKPDMKWLLMMESSATSAPAKEIRLKSGQTSESSCTQRT